MARCSPRAPGFKANQLTKDATSAGSLLDFLHHNATPHPWTIKEPPQTRINKVMLSAPANTGSLSSNRMLISVSILISELCVKNLAPSQFFFRNNCTISKTVYNGGESKKNYIPIHKVLEQPWRHFTSLKLCKCFQVPHPSPRVTATSSRTKANHHWLNHLQTLHTY